ncbi:MAG: hypothetical protein OXL98_02070 [Acidimicrobiaceae bacterium]|nr:hypothetical protein [Acidimicrobiaceae bacterium]
MVSNYDRILAEITKEARQLAPDHGVDAEALVTVAMEIVDLEDQHRIKSINIKQQVEDKIFTTAVSQMPLQDS